MPVASFVATGTACGRHSVAAGARGVSLPPRPPIPSPARFIQEDSALRECRRIPSGNRPPVKRLHTLLADVSPQKTAGFPATPKNPHSQKSKTSARYFPYSSALSRPADFPAVTAFRLLSRPPVFRYVTSGKAPPSAPPPMQRWRGREGDPGRPKGGRSAAAGADITPATGRGRFAPTPRATRGGRGTAS